MHVEQGDRDTPVSVLIVDDDPRNLLALEEMLRNLAVKIVSAHSGEEAIARVEEEDFAVILLDVRMRRLDGFETARLIRAEERSRYTPIIFITAYDEFPQEKAYALGAVDYLVKPLDVDVLRSRTAAFVDMYRRNVRLRKMESDLQERRTLGALQAIEDRNAAILNTALDAIITSDHRGTILDFNPAAEQIFGYSRAEVIGRDLAQIVIPERYRAAHYKGMAHYLASGEGPVLNKRIEMPGLRADGSEFPVELAITPIIQAGKPIFTAYIRDITERVQATRRRTTRYAVTEIVAKATSIPAAMAQVLKAICESLEWDVGAFWQVDADNSVLRCVELWHRPQVIVREFEKASRERTFESGIGLPGQVWRKAEPVWIADVTKASNFPRGPIAAKESLHSAFGIPIVLESEVLGVIEFFSREIREPDSDLLEMMATVGGQVGLFMERQQAEDALKEADRRKDEFLATLSHELRNPLAPITMGLDLVRIKGSSEPDVVRLYDMMERQVSHMVRLVDDLLEVSRVTRGKIELHKERIELGEILQTAIDAVKPLIDAGKHQFSTSLPPSPVFIEADAVRIAQVISNLLNNAVKYTPEGGNIYLVAEVMKKRREVVITVRDTGIGIAGDMLARVFDLFTQVDRSQKRAQGGLGIGLTLVKSLVEMHGGRVEAKSTGLGQGSEFVVRLPLAKEEPVVTAPAQPDVTEREIDLTARRILAIEDNRDTADSLGMLLTSMGAEVEVVYDGPTALAAMRRWRPNLVLLDIGMPGMDGYEVARRVRLEPEFNGIKLVALTGWGQEADRRRAKAAGFDYHLTKPVNAKTLKGLFARIAEHNP